MVGRCVSNEAAITCTGWVAGGGGGGGGAGHSDDGGGNDGDEGRSRNEN